MAKRSIFLMLAFASAMMAVHVHAQPCISQNFPYTFCDGQGHLIEKCSADPHRERGLTPMRVEEPPCFIPAKIYPEVIEITGYPGPQVIQVFNPSQAVTDMNEAWKEWADLCPGTQGPPNNAYCCVKVYMSRNYFDFADAVNNLNTTSKYLVSNKACRKRCDKSPEIMINFTDDLMWQNRDPDGPQQVVWFSGRRSPYDDYDRLSCDQALSFRQMVQENMGEFFGLSARGDGKTGCEDPATLMGNPVTEDDPTGLTPNDICYFRKLYCPDAVGLQPALGVDEPAAGLSLSQNMPNPFDRMTTIPYSLAKSGTVHLSLFNAAGQEIKVLVNQHADPGPYTFGFHPDPDMPPGTYWYVLRVDNVMQARRMILVR